VFKPRRLQPGDRVAAVTLSWGGAGEHPWRYQAGKRQLQEEFGIEVVETRHALRNAEWIRNNPRARADDLMDAFADPSVRGVFSTIGGDESIRLLPYLDLQTIRCNPKVFLGYSDTTVTHWACFKAGVVSFYGPSILAGFAETGGIFPYTASAIRRALFSTEPIGYVQPSRDGWTSEHVDWDEPEARTHSRRLDPPEPWRFLQGRGVMEGRLIGGCLEVVEFLRGTSLWPEPDVWAGAILFLETSEEAPPPRTLERALRSYAAMGVLDTLSGLLLGRPGGGVSADRFLEYEAAVLRVVAEEQGRDDLPIVTRMDFGHTDPMFVLPYGVRARIDCDRQRFEIVESGVVE
jgi:muramoyltetrapeptide carboxypeptidase LdcA involved in peptidoglycan recycling